MSLGRRIPWGRISTSTPGAKPSWVWHTPHLCVSFCLTAAYPSHPLALWAVSPHLLCSSWGIEGREAVGRSAASFLVAFPPRQSPGVVLPHCDT